MNAFRSLLLGAAIASVVGCKTIQLPPAMNGSGGQAAWSTQDTSQLMAQDTGSGFAPQYVTSSDAQTNAAVQAAMPTIQAVLSQHRCIRMGGLARLNALAVPGEDMTNYFNVPNSQLYLRYHDYRKCLTVRQVDRWEMPALNALEFRAVFYADDSGETVNMGYSLRKMDNGAWLLYRIRSRV